MNYEVKKVLMDFDDGHKEELELQFPVREKDRVYIVGCSNSKDLVPWDDKDAEFWGVNNLYGTPLPGSHYDRWFEIHNIWQDPKTKKLIRRGSEDFRGQKIADYLNGLAQLNCTIYMQKHWQGLIPMSIPYPIDDIINFFVSKGIKLSISRYLTNTITYEIALAIYLGFKDVQVWGVDMSIGTEYEAQRPSCEFWLGVAAGLGISIDIPPQADLLKCRFMYGFEEKQQDIWREKLEKVRVDIKMKRRQIEQRHSEDAISIQQSLGAEHAISEISKIWTNLADDLLYQKRGS